MKKDFKEQISNFGVKMITQYKYLILILFLTLTIISYIGVQKLEIDSSNESFFPEDDPIIVQNNSFKEIFGNEEFIFVLIEADDVFGYDVLKYIRQLSDDLEENLPFVKEVTLLTNLQYMESEGYDLRIDNLIGDKIPEDRESLDRIRKRALSNNSYVDMIISEDSKETGIIINFERMPEYVYLPVEKDFKHLDQVNWETEDIIMRSDIFSEEASGLNKVSDPRKIIPPALGVILNRHQNENIKVTASGISMLDYEGDRVIAEEGAKFGLISLIICIILMIVMFKDLRATIGPFLVIFITLLVLYGTMGWIGIAASITSIIIPTLILVISVSYSIHVINHFQYKFRETGSRLEAIKYLYQEATWPIFITTITTALGFISFMIVPIRSIRDLGMFCAFGVLITYLLVMILIPAILALGKDKDVKEQKSNREKNDSQLISRWADFVVDNSLITTIGSFLLVTIFIFFSFRMPVSSDFVEIMGDDFSIVKDSKYMTERLGALYSYEVLIDLPEEGLAQDPRILKSIDEITYMINNLELTSNVLALTDIIKEINKTMHENNEEYYRIPYSQNLIAQYLLLYEISGGEGLEDWVDFNYKKMRISVQVNGFGKILQDDFDEIINLVNLYLPEGTEVTVVGDAPIMLKMLVDLIEGQVKSIILALGVITLVMILILKSVKLGLLSMIPNTLPVVVITGLMGILDYPLDVLTILIAPMIIGIAVDDTVHYFLHFKEEFERNNSYIEANKATFKKIGRALIFTSIILIVGFAIFGLSKVNSMTHVGILSAAGVFSALVADMLITPAIFVLLKPLKDKADVDVNM
ncbi:efflux RND transporter permease subunit [Halonatronum saccharophilum]|uniref:efflux RND transporter permease subunit n=1 Tax=Halonatronum saccharophilum TaxID=150060 RepID=UPI000482858C|nr:MMPL family transporter [Halonatronum saccharophilum]